MLYLLTMLAAPWLLREGRHIRVDIVLRVLPPRAAYACEWIADVLGLACCCWMVWYGARRRRTQLRERRALDQDAGDAGVVVHGAAAGLLRAARGRVRVSHAPPRRGRGEPRDDAVSAA